MAEKKAAAFRKILIVFIVLAVLTGVEFFVAQAGGSAVLLFLIAFAKTGLILNYFMHVYRLWREDAH